MPILGQNPEPIPNSNKVTKALQKANNLSTLQSNIYQEDSVAPVGAYFSSDSKYDEGMPTSYLDNIDQYRASRQPWYEQAGAMLNQAVVGEIIGGTLMSVGAISGIPEMILNTLNDSENDFHNAIFDLGKGLSDWAQEITPIYQSGERFSDPGWWFQNGVSVASSLSMMLPGMAAAKVGRGIGKGLRLAAVKMGTPMKYGRTVQDIIGTTVGALAMRHAEGFREASGVYDSIYQQGLQAYNEGKLPDIKSEDEIKSIASNAAALDYNLNYLNLAFDFIQLGSILKPFKGLTRNTGLLGYDLAKSVGKLPKSKLGKAFHWLAEPGKGLLEQTSEGVEEIINTIAQFEGERKGRLDLGLEKEDNSSVGERIMDYLGRPETMDSFIWGTLGGVAFKQGAKVLGFDETKTQLNRKLSEIAGREETIKQFSQHFNAINNGEIVTDDNGEVLNDYSKTTVEQRLELTNDLKNKMAFRLGLDAAQAGNIDLLLAQLDDSNFKNSLIQSGIATQETITTDIQNIKKEVLRAEDTYSKYFQRLYELPINDNVKRKLLNEAIQLDYRRTSALEGIRELETEYNNLYSKDGFIQVNSSNPNLNPTLQMESLSVAIALVTNDIEDAKKSKNEYAVKQGEKIKSNLQKKLNSIPKHEHINPKLIDIRIPYNLAQQEILKEYVNIFSEDIANVDSKDNVSKVTEEITNRQNEINTELNKNIKDEELKRKNERIAREKLNKKLDNLAKKISTANEKTIFTAEELQLQNNHSAELEKKLNKLYRATPLEETKSSNNVESFDSFLDDIQTAPLEETTTSANIESFDAFLDAQAQESKQESSDTKQSVSYEQKIADIERRSQEALNKADTPKLKGFERLSNLIGKPFNELSGSDINESNVVNVLNEIYRIRKNGGLTDTESRRLQRLEDAAKSIGFEIIDPIGKKYDERDTIDVVNFVEGTSSGSTDRVITRVIRPQVNKNGVLEQRAQVEIMQSATEEEINNAINKFKEDSINKRKEEINAKYDTELKALEQEQVTEESGLEPDNTDLGTLLEETSIDVDTEIKSDKITTVVSDNTYFDDSKAKAVSEAYSSLVEDMKNANGAKTVDSDGNITYENSKIENAYNALAHQDRKYTRIKDGKTVKYTDISNELSDTAPLELLTPGKYPIGTKVEFIVADKDDLEIYDPDSMDKIPITWAVYKNRLQELNPGTDITTLQDYKNNIPIQLSIDGKELNAYLHSVSWINQENVKGDLVQDAINLRNIREGILSKGSYSTTIESISDGAIFELNNNAKHSIKEAVGEDTNYIIGVETGVGIKTGKNKMLSESISNESTVPGLTYLVVKSHNGYFGIPVSNSKIGNNPNKEAIKSTIVSAIDAYLTDNTETRDSIRNITGLNILQLSDLEYLLNMYLGFYNTNGNFLRDIIMTIPHGTKNTYFTIQNKTIEFFDGDLKTGGRVYSVSKENQKQKDLFLDKLVDSLDNFYLNNSIEAFDNNENIPIFDDTNNIVPKPYRDLIMESFTTNAKGNKVSEVNGKSIYSYTLQPVYRFDFNEFLPKEEDKPIDIDRLKRAYKALKALVDAGNTGGSNLKELQRMEEEIKRLEEPRSSEGLSTNKESLKVKKSKLREARKNFNSLGTTPESNFIGKIKNSHKNC